MLTFLRFSLVLHQAAEPTWLITLLTQYLSLSVAALSLDLEKAFDRAVREAVMGYPSHVGSDPVSRRAHLENVGYPPVVVREILRMNENRPPLLEDWGVSAKATRLIAASHSGSWFRYGEFPSVAETRQGGGQGCKLGSLKLSCVCRNWCGFCLRALGRADQMI